MGSTYSPPRGLLLATSEDFDMATDNAVVLEVYEVFGSTLEQNLEPENLDVEPPRPRNVDNVEFRHQHARDRSDPSTTLSDDRGRS